MQNLAAKVFIFLKFLIEFFGLCKYIIFLRRMARINWKQKKLAKANFYSRIVVKITEMRDVAKRVVYEMNLTLSLLFHKRASLKKRSVYVCLFSCFVCESTED